MAGAMMSRAQRDQVFGSMRAAFFARLNMVQVDEVRMAAARYLAAMPVSTQHRATNSGRHVLRRALRLAILRRALRLVVLRRALRLAVLRRALRLVVLRLALRFVAP